MMDEKEQENGQENLATEILNHLIVQNKRMFVILMVVLFMFFGSEVYWLWSFNQYDFQSYELESNDGGNANFIGNDGDITNGIGKSKTENEEEPSISPGNGDETPEKEVNNGN